MTDLYEWGWGQSFHFSPKLPGKDWGACEVAHEARIPAILGLGPGKTALDCGCGVGGPMRTIAACSGGNVVGITINAYQVQRAKYHNEKVRVGVSGGSGVGLCAGWGGGLGFGGVEGVAGRAPQPDGWVAAGKCLRR